ncbi:FAD-dependent monooxygenase [Mycobacterium sp. BMJ-28]
MQSILDDRGPGGLQIGTPVWAATFNVHARTAQKYRDQQIFLAGDAAHIHSPAGGQGLNAGIHDVHNLAWKLAEVIDGANPALLDSYETERHHITSRIVRNADLQTRGWMLDKWWQILLRDTAMRIANQTGLLDRHYAAQLAGRSHRYPASTALRPHHGKPVGTRLSRHQLHLNGVPMQGWRILTDRPVGIPGEHVVPPLLRSIHGRPAYVLVRPDDIIAAAGQDPMAAMAAYEWSKDSRST